MTARPKAVDRPPPTLPTRVIDRLYLFRGREWLWVWAGLAAALAWPLAVSDYWLHVTNLALIAVVGAIGLNLLTGNARLVSLGQAAFLAIGGFTAGALALHYSAPFWLGLLLATVAGGFVGLVVGFSSLRLKALYVAVTTLALHFGVTSAFAIYLARLVHSEAMLLDPPDLGFVELLGMKPWYWFLLAVALLTIVAALNIQRSFIGRRWIAVADHEIASRALGVSVHRAKLWAFVVSSMIVAFAGAVGAYYEGVVTAGFYNLQLAIAYLAMIIVGGVGSVLGSVLGAFVITVLPYLLDAAIAWAGGDVSAGSISGLHALLYGALIVGFMLFEPQGLTEVWRRTRNLFMLWPFRYRPLERRHR